jgi:hypothetical protein
VTDFDASTALAPVGLGVGQDARDYIAASRSAARSIQAVTGHKSTAMLRRYIRAGSLFQETVTTLDL